MEAAGSTSSAQRRSEHAGALAVGLAVPARTIAVIAMCKAPEPGRTKTRLCPPLSPDQASNLYAALLSDTLDLVEALPQALPIAAITPPDGMPYFEQLGRAQLHCWPVDGADIGACLQQALDRALREGYPCAIAINSDGPTLPPEFIADTSAALRTGADAVFGPNEDGGYYLIGLRRPQPRLLLNADREFEDIAWSTGAVLAQTLARAQALGLQVACLPSRFDVDRYDDLLRLTKELASLPLDRCRNTRAWLRDNPVGD